MRGEGLILAAVFPMPGGLTPALPLVLPLVMFLWLGSPIAAGELNRVLLFQATVERVVLEERWSQLSEEILTVVLILLRVAAVVPERELATAAAAALVRLR